MEKSNGRKSEKNRDFSTIFPRFFETGRFFQHLSGRVVHARRRRVWADFIGDKSAINAKYRRFLDDFSGIYRGFFWPLDFFQLLIRRSRFRPLFLKNPTAIFLIQRLILNLKLDLTVQIDF